MRYGGADRSPPRRTSTPLLDLDLGAGRLELLLELVGLRLGDATLDLLGGGLDEVLRLLEAEARDDADLLDDVDLVRAGVGEDDGELRLLLHWRGGGGGPATGDHHRRGGRDAPLLLELLDQVRRLHDGERGELVDDRVQVCHVLSRFLFVPGAPAPGVFTYRGLLLPELILAGVQDLGELLARGREHPRDPDRRLRDDIGDRRAQLLDARHLGQRLHPLRVDDLSFDHRRADRELLAVLGEVHQDLRGGHHVAVRHDERGRADELVGELLDRRALGGTLSQGVLDDLVVDLRVAELLPKLRHGRHVETPRLRQDGGLGLHHQRVKLADDLFLLRPVQAVLTTFPTAPASWPAAAHWVFGQAGWPVRRPPGQAGDASETFPSRRVGLSPV